MNIKYTSGTASKDLALSDIMGEIIYQVDLFSITGQKVYSGPMDERSVNPLRKNRKVKFS